jgi:hypothetical protein
MSTAARDPEQILGRDAEIELLDSLLDGIHQGGGSLVPYGEPEIGEPGCLPSRLGDVATNSPLLVLAEAP